MGKSNTGKREKSRVSYEALESWARGKVQDFLQEVLEQEVTMFLGRFKSERIYKVVGCQCRRTLSAFCRNKMSLFCRFT